MPDDRLFHKRLGHSQKVNSLTDLEDLTWRAYVLSADDFGVMRFSAITIQADHDRFLQKSQKVVQRALDRVRDAGLVVTFEHQGRIYCAQPDWQNHQRVRHPRQTINPKPPDDVLATFTHATQQLFCEWPGKRKETVAKDFGNSSETVQHLVRAGACETANGLRLTANGPEGGSGETAPVTPPERAGAFCRWYEDTHQRIFDVGYMGTNMDYTHALKLVNKFSDSDLRDAALVWFGQDDDFATSGTRTIAKFASRVTGCLQTIRQRGIA